MLGGLYMMRQTRVGVGRLLLLAGLLLVPAGPAAIAQAIYGNNGVNWQWTAGTGVDSNMFPRIMAPLSQSEKFDAADYIREWVPELADLPDDAIHDPEDAGSRPEDYPEKLIGHREARERALAAYAKTKG